MDTKQQSSLVTEAQATGTGATVASNGDGERVTTAGGGTTAGGQPGATVTGNGPQVAHQAVQPGANGVDKVYSSTFSEKPKGRGPDRDARGRLLPGHSQPGPGRPKRDHEQRMLRAITDVLTPEEMKQWLTEALAIAHSQKSTRGIMQVLEFAASYGLGKPTQRIEHSDTATPAEWLDAMLAGDGDNETGDANTD